MDKEKLKELCYSCYDESDTFFHKVVSELGLKYYLNSDSIDRIKFAITGIQTLNINLFSYNNGFGIRFVGGAAISLNSGNVIRYNGRRLKKDRVAKVIDDIPKPIMDKIDMVYKNMGGVISE